MANAKYLFITYGEPGWRGVQMRAIRIASYFSKEEVLFWNGYDSSIIKEADSGLSLQAGFKVETVATGLSATSEIVFPKGVEIVIFADLPTNELFSFTVFAAATQKGIKTVICEQLYRKGQLKEGVFSRFVKQSDLFLVNALSYFLDEEAKTVKIVPPQVEYDPALYSKGKIRASYGIPADAFLLFGSGYHEEVQKKILVLHDKLAAKYPHVYTIISGSAEQKHLQKDRCIILPFQMGEEYIKLLYACDVAIVKFGFLQIMEALALGKPTFVIGEAGYVLQEKNVLDPALREALFFYEDNDSSLYSDIDKIITNVTFRNKVISNIQLLHNGELFGGKKAAEYIQELSVASESKHFARRHLAKKLAILINNEIFEKEEWLKKQSDVYSVCFIVAMPRPEADRPLGETINSVVKRMPRDMLKRPISDLQLSQDGEILPHSFKEVYVFSKRKFDGLTDIFPWYEAWVKRLQMLIDEADEVYVSKQGRKLFGNLLEKHEKKVKYFA